MDKGTSTSGSWATHRMAATMTVPATIAASGSASPALAAWRGACCLHRTCEGRLAAVAALAAFGAVGAAAVVVAGDSRDLDLETLQFLESSLLDLQPLDALIPAVQWYKQQC